jgi:hypothetical protein
MLCRVVVGCREVALVGWLGSWAPLHHGTALHQIYNTTQHCTPTTTRHSTAPPLQHGTALHQIYNTTQHCTPTNTTRHSIALERVHMRVFVIQFFYILCSKLLTHLHTVWCTDQSTQYSFVMAQVVMTQRSGFPRNSIVLY